MSKQVFSLERRANYHQAQYDSAKTLAAKFWRAAAALLVEARRQRRLREVTRWVLDKTEELRTTARFKAEERPGSTVHLYDPDQPLTERVLRAMGESRRVS